MTDPINPSHYKDRGIEPIDVIEVWKLGFCLGNIVKYIARADHKGSRLEDLKKAAWYLAREIASAEAREASAVPAGPFEIKLPNHERIAVFGDDAQLQAAWERVPESLAVRNPLFLENGKPLTLMPGDAGYYDVARALGVPVPAVER